MGRKNSKGAEEARSQLPELLDAAERGRATVITRHGKPVAELVPIGQRGPREAQSLLPLCGTGRGLWGERISEMLDKLRDEWSR